MFEKKTNNKLLSGFLSGLVLSPITNVIELYKIKYQTHITKKIPIYRGIYSTTLRDTIGFSIYFSSFDYMNNYNIDINKDIQTLLSGGFAGVFSWIFSYPFDVIKTRMQTDNILMIDAIKKGYLFNGLGLCLSRCFLVNSVGFYLYDYIIKLNG